MNSFVEDYLKDSSSYDESNCDLFEDLLMIAWRKWHFCWLSGLKTRYHMHNLLKTLSSISVSYIGNCFVMFHRVLLGSFDAFQPYVIFEFESEFLKILNYGFKTQLNFLISNLRG